MLFLRRTFLVLMVLIVPAFVTRLSYDGAVYMVARLHRYISPQTLHLAAIVEFAMLFFITVLEARARWTPLRAE